MTNSGSYVSVWKLCALTCLAMVLLSLIPQIHLWVVRGRNWNGAYVSAYVDEPRYAAYVNALIDGRARKNDPYGGKDDSLNTPLPESFFSIQFVPPYAIASLARMSGISASTAFIVLTPLAALLASLAVFALLKEVTNNHLLAAAGTLFVLCLGRFIGRYGFFGTFLDIGFPALPFLRRYQPSVTFPLFFAFQLLVWRALTCESKRRLWLSAIMAGFTLTTLVFSYLYLWTTAAAWLACIGGLWLCFRYSERRQSLSVLTTIGVIAAAAFVPYAYLLSRRATIGDENLLVSLTHRPDLFRIHEILGAAVLVVLIIGVWRHRIVRSEPRAVYAASLALLPFIVFNQQVLTGRTAQVFHFENFILGYSTLVAVLILATLFWKSVPKRVLIWMASLSFAWGLIAVGLPSRLFFVPGAIANDQKIPVLRRLLELSKDDGTMANLLNKVQPTTLVFSPSVNLITQLPTWTSQGTLLDLTGIYCGGITREEAKEFFYMHLYYSKTQSESLQQALSGSIDTSHEELKFAPDLIFGQARIFPELSSQASPLQPDEIDREVQVYQRYVDSFSREEALRRPIKYAVIPADRDFDFTHLDRWYERDQGERVGDYTLYRLELRN